MVEKSCMTRLWISSLHQMANEMGKKIMSFAVPIDKRMKKNLPTNRWKKQGMHNGMTSL